MGYTYLSTAVMATSNLDKIDSWLTAQALNKFGDPAATMYMGGTPLFDESTGQAKERLDYLLEKFPSKPWEEAAEPS